MVNDLLAKRTSAPRGGYSTMQARDADGRRGGGHDDCPQDVLTC